MMDSNVPTAEAREFAMLDPDQVSTLNALERMGATLSLFGISLIFVTFGVFKRLRTIPNTFIFFASIANIGACVACLIAYDGITAMNKNRFSPLCQAQGFIFEWYVFFHESTKCSWNCSGTSRLTGCSSSGGQVYAV